MMSEITNNQLLARLLRVGIRELPPNHLGELADTLEDQAENTALAAPLFVSEAIRTIESLFKDHDGKKFGVRSDFLEVLDTLIRRYVPEIQEGDPLQATNRARRLRDEIEAQAADYDPRKTQPRIVDVSTGGK
jgi:hypothetical protein